MDARLCFQAFGFQPADGLLVVKEQHLADSNFVFAYLLKQVLANANQRVVLLLTHNSLAHYQCVAQKLGYDLLSKVHTDVVSVVNFQDILARTMSNLGMNVVADILELVRKRTEELCMDSNVQKVYIFIDDFTHLQDCTFNLSDSLNILNSLLGFHYNHRNVVFNIGLHMGDEEDQVLSNNLEYSADCIIDVSLMKTGRSDDISGILKVIRNKKVTIYHYKVREYGVDICAPGKFLIA